MFKSRVKILVTSVSGWKIKIFPPPQAVWTVVFCSEPRMAEKQLHVYSFLLFVKAKFSVS